MDGILSRMYRDRAKPTTATDTLLLQLLPAGKGRGLCEEATGHEEALVARLTADGRQMDTGFANMLIRRRAVRGDYIAAKVIGVGER